MNYLAVSALLLSLACSSDVWAESNKKQDESLGIPGPDWINVFYILTVDGTEVRHWTGDSDIRQDNIRCVNRPSSMPIVTYKKYPVHMLCNAIVKFDYNTARYALDVELRRNLKPANAGYVLQVRPHRAGVALQVPAGMRTQQYKMPTLKAGFRTTFTEAQIWADRPNGVYGLPLKVPVAFSNGATGELRLLVMPEDNAVGRHYKEKSWFGDVQFQHKDREYFANMIE